MSDRRNHSPSGRGMSSHNASDDDHSPARDKFRRERSLDDDSYMDTYQPNTDEYGRYPRSKRHIRSPSPNDERRHKYRRTSPSSPPSHHHSRNYRGNYSRPKREGRDQDYNEGDHYIPNYERDGYTPGARYGHNTEQVKQKQSNNHHHQQQQQQQQQHQHQHQQQQQHHPYNRQQHQNKLNHMHHQANSPKIDYDITNPSMIVNNWSSISRIPLVDPHQLDYIVSFKQYCDYLRQSHPKGEIMDDEFQKRYDDYKEKIAAKQLTQFFNNNKEKQWFLEKYHPQTSKPRMDDMKQIRSINFEKFMQSLELGEYDNIQNDVDDNSKYTDSNDSDEVSTHFIDNNNNNPTSTSDEEYDSHLVIKTVPPTIPREKIIDMCKKVNGFKYLALSEPSVTRKFHRIGWIRFSDETDIQKAFNQLDNQKIDDFTFHLAMNRKTQPSAGRSSRVAPDITSTPGRLFVDLEQAKQLTKVMDDGLGKSGLQDVINRAHKVTEQLQTPADSTETTNSNENGENNDILGTKKELDLIMVYLRHVHMYCYYCGLECDSTEELTRRCPEPHHRKVSSGTRSDSKQGSKNDRLTQQWIRNLDQRVKMKSNPPNDEGIINVGGKFLKSEIDAYLKDHILKEHDAKYKCKVGDCAKAFKGVEFVEKHIISKHNDEVQRMKDEVIYYNNYVLDPNHLLPLTTNNNSSSNNSSSVISGTINLPANTGAFGGASSFMIPSNGMTAMGTPWDKIPRIGFGGNVGWSNSGRARVGSLLPSATSDMMVEDPRQVKSYVDLDAPTSGDSNISFY